MIFQSIDIQCFTDEKCQMMTMTAKKRYPLTHAKNMNTKFIYIYIYILIYIIYYSYNS